MTGAWVVYTVAQKGVDRKIPQKEGHGTEQMDRNG